MRYYNNTTDMELGDRVELHPALDKWMQGDRYGTITYIRDDEAEVKLDKSGRTIYLPPQDLRRI